MLILLLKDLMLLLSPGRVRSDRLCELTVLVVRDRCPRVLVVNLRGLLKIAIASIIHCQQVFSRLKLRLLRLPLLIGLMILLELLGDLFETAFL